MLRAIAVLAALSGPCWTEGATRMGAVGMKQNELKLHGGLKLGMALRREAWIGGQRAEGEIKERRSGMKERRGNVRMSLQLRGGADQTENDPVTDVVGLVGGMISACGAEQCFLKAIEMDPNNAEALCSYGVLLHESSNNYQEATKYFEMALKSNPLHIDSLHFYGGTNHRHDYDAAEQYFGKALQVDPNRVDLLSNFAVFLEDIRKDSNRAMEYYMQALKISPDDVVTMSHYGGFWLRHGKEEEAERWLWKSILRLQNPSLSSDDLWAGNR
eukprot:768376-Hanusia_phi.AAC.1